MLSFETTSKFRRDLKLARKRGLDLSLMNIVIELLLKGEELPQRLGDHELKGVYKGYRECHILPDWLLIYKVDKERLVLTATRTGTHSDLFEN